jgi:FG-GAP repeat
MGMKVTWCWVGFARCLIVVSCLMFVGCTRVVQPGTAEVPLFTDVYLDTAQLTVATQLEQVIGRQEADVFASGEAPLEHRMGGLESQAVLVGSSGFIYYIQHNPNLTIDPYRVYRFDQHNDVRTLVYGGKREVQAIAGSYDGNFLVLSMRQTTTTPNDFEIFRFNILSQSAQRLTDNNVDDTNVSMSGDVLSVTWEAPVSGRSKIFFRKYMNITAATAFTESVLVSIDPQRQPSLSANGIYVALVRDLSNGKDQVFRYNLSSNVYTSFSAQSLIPLEHPSINNNGKQVAWLQNDVTSDQIILRNTSVNTMQTVAGPLETLEHPFISADGQFLTYGKIETSTLKVFTKNLSAGTELKLTDPLAPASNKGMTWQMVSFRETKFVPPADGTVSFGSYVKVSGDIMIVLTYAKTLVYLYNGSNWSLHKQLVVDNAAVVGRVAVEGDTIVVGNNVFQRNQGGSNNFGFVTKLVLVAEDGTMSMAQPQSIDLSGDTVVMGMPIHRDLNGNGIIECNSLTGEYLECSVGVAYIFERNQGGANAWGQVKRLTASDAASRDSFGSAVAIRGDTVVVGTQYKNLDTDGNGVIDCDEMSGSGADCGVGAAYVFQRHQGGTNAWGQVKRLIASNGGRGFHYGSSLAVQDDFIAVGSSGEEHDTNSNGVVDCTEPFPPRHHCGF